MFLFFAPAAFAQGPPRTGSVFGDTYYDSFNRYNSFKDSLPFYFFTYASGGVFANEFELDEADLLARAYVVSFPVLITGDFDQDPYTNWLRSVWFIPDTATSRVPDKKQKQQLLSADEKRLKEVELNAQRNEPGEDSTKRAERIKSELDGIAEKRKSIEKQTLTEAKTNSANQNLSDTVQNTQGDSAKSDFIAQLKLKNVHDTLLNKLATMGEENGLRWLYAKQVLSGNVLFCNPETNIPVWVASSTDEKGIADFYTLLNFWKKRYGFLLLDSKLEAHIDLAQGADVYFGKFGKSSTINPNLALQQKQLMKEKEKCSAP